jgi:hypothetical protein
VEPVPGRSTTATLHRSPGQDLPLLKKCSVAEATKPSDEATKSVDASHQRKAKSVEVGQPSLNFTYLLGHIPKDFSVYRL